MNTSRYNKDDASKAVALLGFAVNSVRPAEYYQTLAATTEADKIHKLLSRAYTVIAEEDGETRQVRVAGIHVADLVKHGKTSVTVAYNQTDEIILIKK